jgi:hypothetical protein
LNAHLVLGSGAKQNASKAARRKKNKYCLLSLTLEEDDAHIFQVSDGFFQTVPNRKLSGLQLSRPSHVLQS